MHRSRGLRRGTTVAALLTLTLVFSLVFSTLSTVWASPSSQAATNSAGTGGATLSFAGGAVVVNVPAGALTETVDIRYTPLTATTAPAVAPTGTVFGSQLLTLEVLKSEAVQSAYTFSRFVQATVKYSAADLAKAKDGRQDNINLYIYDSSFKQWNLDAAAIRDVVNNTLTTSQTTLGTYALVITPQPVTPTPTPTLTATPPKTGDVAPSSGLLLGTAIAGAVLLLVGAYLFIRRPRRSEA